MNGQFGTKELSAKEELRWKTEIFDTKMNPREWMARFGHNILVGDYRVYKYQDKDFGNWIYAAFEALVNEGLEALWKEFLTETEIEEVREQYNNF
ncbi:hypothetical protein [Fulvivirga kasyanovii]|uniref:Uncharacterized protein n=1 Tax=Fulvivirga kasyanovii TaxID=396812 RepID=A0ABW9RJF0_9BACT|nr:hypothetical protein [Fulvivirga kasyanovii]MTI23553.1 hypothetical protein [Fulvivirga kasyanovii]